MNFTWRARGFLVLAAAAVAVGVALRQEPVALAGLTVVVWIGVEWVNFRVRTLTAGEVFSPRRRLIGEQSRSSLVLVKDQESRVQLELHVSSRLRGLRCYIEDVVPESLAVVNGSPALAADIGGAEVLRWSYVLRPAVIRKTALSGLHVAITDPQGLFRLQRFLPLRQEVTVLPFLVRPQATVSVLKRQNVQMMPGTHRYRRPGFSTELLGIRDYQVGDPPRSIAWKATARLGKLMTCEYESEAPVRATLVADLSPSQFLGRPGPARADRIIAGGASVARLLLADGDPVAGLIVSRSEQTWLPHGLGERHLSRLLLRWLSFVEPLSVEGMDLEALVRLAWTCGFRRFPELFDQTVNDPQVGWLVWGRRRRIARLRWQLSLALATVYGGEAHLPTRLQYDDRVFRDYCRRFLEDHRGTVDLAKLHRRAAASRHEERQAAHAITRGLLTGAARASDNELFVLIGAVPSEEASRDELLDAVRVARGAHHRVLMIDVGPPPAPQRVQDETARRILEDMRDHGDQELYADFERRLVRLGSKIARLDDPRLMQQVAAEIEILRLARARATGGGR